jgi:hypothetical protein
VTPDSVRVDLIHASMQVHDTTDQKTQDARDIFKRAYERNVWWVTGTEANTAADAAIYKAEAQKRGFTFYRKGGDVWVALRNARFSGHAAVADFTQVIDGVAGKHPNIGILRVTGRNAAIGKVTVLVGHYLTLKGDPNGVRNRKIAMEANRQGRIYGAGRDIVFYAGDQNQNDRYEDTFYGGPFTSIQDELKKYEGTHGTRPIDVIGSWNYDGRVKGAYVNVLDDKEFFQHGDHFVLEAGYDVRPLGLG